MKLPGAHPTAQPGAGQRLDDEGQRIPVGTEWRLVAPRSHGANRAQDNTNKTQAEGMPHRSVKCEP